jgi:predicted enzyme related to lactoylglutathione lyase
MKILGADYVYYDVSDLKKSTEFYRDVLGLKLAAETDEFAEFDLGNVTLAIGSYGEEKPQKVKEGPSIALAVDDVAKALEYLKSKNVQITHNLIPTPVCEMAIITDLDGNQIVLHHRKDGTFGNH